MKMAGHVTQPPGRPRMIARRGKASRSASTAPRTAAVTSAIVFGSAALARSVSAAAGAGGDAGGGWVDTATPGTLRCTSPGFVVGNANRGRTGALGVSVRNLVQQYEGKQAAAPAPILRRSPRVSGAAAPPVRRPVFGGGGPVGMEAPAPRVPPPRPTRPAPAVAPEPRPQLSVAPTAPRGPGVPNVSSLWNASTLRNASTVPNASNFSKASGVPTVPAPNVSSLWNASTLRKASTVPNASNFSNVSGVPTVPVPNVSSLWNASTFRNASNVPNASNASNFLDASNFSNASSVSNASNFPKASGTPSPLGSPKKSGTPATSGTPMVPIRNPSALWGAFPDEGTTALATRKPIYRPLAWPNSHYPVRPVTGGRQPPAAPGPRVEAEAPLLMTAVPYMPPASGIVSGAGGTFSTAVGAVQPPARTTAPTGRGSSSTQQPETVPGSFSTTPSSAAPLTPVPSQLWGSAWGRGRGDVRRSQTAPVDAGGRVGVVAAASAPAGWSAALQRASSSFFGTGADKVSTGASRMTAVAESLLNDVERSLANTFAGSVVTGTPVGTNGANGANGANGTSELSVLERGLVNSGTSCFFNSALRVLRLTDSFVDEKLPAEVTSEDMFDLLAVLHQLRPEPGVAREPLSAESLLQSQSLFEPFARGMHDPSEVFDVILDRLQEEAGAGVRATFGGSITRTSECGGCGRKSAIDEPFTNMVIPLPEKTDAVPLEELVVDSLAKELVEGVRCSVSHCRAVFPAAVCERSAAIKKAPEHLVLTLKRTQYGPEGPRKVHTPVDFPQRLDLPGELFEKTARSSNIGPGPGAGVGYELYSVVVHAGSGSHGGHYITLGRHENDPNGPWFVYDDGRVRQIAWSADASPQTRVSNFVKTHDYTPYMLLYRKVSSDAAGAAQTNFGGPRGN